MMTASAAAYIYYDDSKCSRLSGDLWYIDNFIVEIFCRFNIALITKCSKQ